MTLKKLKASVRAGIQSFKPTQPSGESQITHPSTPAPAPSHGEAHSAIRRSSVDPVKARPARLAIQVLPAIIVSAIGAWSLVDWVVDDAAISYSYARNLAQGAGMVAQASHVPVEGFSNPLWVFLLAGLILMLGHGPVIVLKLLSWVLLAGFLGVVARSLISRGASSLSVCLALILLALQPSLLIWSNAGLEGPLLFFLLIALGTSLVAVTANVHSLKLRHALGSGALAACCALTRPEGILYAFSALALLIANRWQCLKSRAHGVLAFFTAFVLPYGGYLTFRRIYFGDWLPNTFYAKGGVTSARILDVVTLSPHSLGKFMELGHAIAGPYGAPLALAVLPALAVVARRKQVLSFASRTFLALSVAASIAYLIMPGDWMGEWRYAAPAVLLFWLSTAHLLLDLCLLQPEARWGASAKLGLIALIALGTVSWVGRMAAFRDQLPMPLAEVVDRARLFKAAAEHLSIPRASILTQDVGGFLLEDQLELYDIGMLTDRRIARAMGEWRTESNLQDLHDYVFEEIQPDFISVTAYHAWAARLEDDDRLARDYLPVNARLDPWILNRYGERLKSGDYVRRDRVPDQATLEAMRRILATSRGPLTPEVHE